MNTEIELLTDILAHISEVQENLAQICGRLTARGAAHDRSKLHETEFDAFLSTRDDFKKANYGTPEYQACVKAIEPAIKHHYANNRHHVFFHEDGIEGMTLIDLLEMVADWRAANRRNPNLSFEDSLTVAQKKYGIKTQLMYIIRNTLSSLGWI